MRVVLLGAGSVGIQIARELIDEKRDVVIIEKDSELARVADNELDCLVLNEDGSRPEVLRKAQTDTADWFIALTGSDAVNIVACGLVASESPKTRTIARVETPFYTALSLVQKKTFGLDILVNPAMEAARALAQIIAEGFAEQVTPLHDGALQLRMVHAAKLEGFSGRTLGEIRQSSLKHYLVAAIVRDKAIIVPKGDSRIHAEDRLYILGTPDSLNSLLGTVEGLASIPRNIIVLGASRISERLIGLLLDANNGLHRGLGSIIHKIFRKKSSITLLDSSEVECKRFAKMFQDIQIINGDCAEEGVLEHTGIAQADLFVAATDSQSKNIITAQLAKVLGAKKSMAITVNHRFLPLGPDMDVDSYVCANDSVAARILEIVRKGHIRTIYSFYEDSVEIVELQISPYSPVQSKSLLEIELPRQVLVAFVQKNSEFIVPTGSTILNSGDMIGLITPKDRIRELEQVFGEKDGDSDAENNGV